MKLPRLSSSSILDATPAKVICLSVIALSTIAMVWRFVAGGSG